MDSTLIRGDTTELQCILAFQKRGYYCSIPFSGSCRYDVVVDVNDKLYKIQCKSSVEKDGMLNFSATHTTTNTKGTTRYQYKENEVDFFYTYWNNYDFLVPMKEVSTHKTLCLKEPTKALLSTQNVAADYLIDKVIKEIDEESLSRYYDNRYIRCDENGEEVLLSSTELHQTYTERQIRYIKECISKKKMGYNYYWKYKEFPSL